MRGSERVAALNRARTETVVEPALALLSAAVGNAVGHHISLRAPLQGIVADRRRRLQRCFDVSRLDERLLSLPPEILVLAIGPYAGKTIGLQLDLNLNAIRHRL